MNATPYHRGELLVQHQLGEEWVAAQSGRAIADAVPTGAINFVQKQSMLVATSLDAQHRVWVSLLVGQPGFVQVIDPQHLKINDTLLAKSADDVLWQNLPFRPQIGLLLIELATRRRLRINGRAEPVPDGWQVRVEQAYPNCPKYIQRREVAGVAAAEAVVSGAWQRGTALTSELTEWLHTADTFFLGSADENEQLDASHRGGNRGFVQVLGNSLRVPDYRGNSMYNTLGNFATNPAAGLLFPDFAGNRVLQLTGKAEILWHVPGTEDATGGTKRFWQFDVEEWAISALPATLRFRFVDYSPFNP